jgi:hypothetical protein
LLPLRRRSGQLRNAHRINYDIPQLAAAVGVDVLLRSMHEVEQHSQAVGGWWCGVRCVVLCCSAMHEVVQLS